MPPNASTEPIIQVLPEEVASKIAAGEVVERPASVVRELLDNAIDAGARRVRVDIAAGGRALIRVVDDGCGVHPSDLGRAFLRHATSKIRTAEDLWAVRTLGFRGEALFSIAAVSRISFVSRPEGAGTGYEMTVEGGEPGGLQPRGAPFGTIVTVRDLFFNLPARLKFLKSPQAEAAYITALVQQYALAFPEVRFTLTSEGRQTFQSNGDGDLRSAAISVYGTEVGRSLLPVGVTPGEYPESATQGGARGDLFEPDRFAEATVYGYVSPPAFSRANRQAMHFFINRRAVQSRMLQFAVEEAYHTLLMVGRHPISILNVVVDPSRLDVNVHPAKAEVKFRDERAVFSAVQRAVRSSLAAHVPPALYGTRGVEGWALPASEPAQGTSEVGGWGLGDGLTTTANPDPQPLTPNPLPAPPPRALPPLRVVGQVASTYLIAEGADGLFLIDQHAAHERVLFERLGAELQQGMLAVQPMLEPLPLEMSPRVRAEMDQIAPLLKELGFEVEAFGDATLLVRALPAIYAASRRDLGSDLAELLEGVIAGGPAERWREELAVGLACHSAIRAGQPLSLDEMRALVDQLGRCRYPRNCAHGRPTMLHLTQDQLEREFGRRA